MMEGISERVLLASRVLLLLLLLCVAVPCEVEVEEEEEVCGVEASILDRNLSKGSPLGNRGSGFFFLSAEGFTSPALNAFDLDSCWLSDCSEASDGSHEFFKSRKSCSTVVPPPFTTNFCLVSLATPALSVYQRASPGDKGTSPSLREELARFKGRRFNRYSPCEIPSSVAVLSELERGVCLRGGAGGEEDVVVPLSDSSGSGVWCLVLLGGGEASSLADRDTGVAPGLIGSGVGVAKGVPTSRESEGMLLLISDVPSAVVAEEESS